MMQFFRRKKEKQSVTEPPLSGGKEITVQNPSAVLPIVNTAIAAHIGTREYQQDAAYVCDPLYEEGLAYGILCDGMGGMEEGERASGEVVVFMANRISTLGKDEHIPAFLERAAVDANRFVLEQNAMTGLKSGTTLLTVLMRGGSLYWLSVGDSRIYIIRDGEIVQTTTDHSYALELQELVESHRLTQEQADADPGKDHLISYIGAPVLERIDLSRSPFQMRYGDIILLCSDGLTKILYPDEILDIVMRRGLEEAAKALPAAAFAQSSASMDNTTVILMQYQYLNNGSVK